MERELVARISVRELVARERKAYLSFVSESPEPRGWYSRGYLPHIEAGSQPQHIIIRLYDSLPAGLIEAWRRELEMLPEEDAKQEMYNRVEGFLDAGHGECILKNPIAAITVQDCLLFGHRRKYELHRWCFMPNHVHRLLTPNEGQTFKSILGPMKSYSALQINRTLGREGHLWQIDFFDRLIRDFEHFEHLAAYIEWNTVKAKLTPDPKHWAYSSANPVPYGKLKEKDSL